MLASKNSLMGKQLPIVLIHNDSTAAIAKIENHYYNELLSTGALRVGHEHTDENLADPFVKGLAREKIHNTSILMR
ncbi:hypothetical protein MTR_6g015835 [Medicago truncatula]|uniref:Uncharacterized protein n=1 Tax=Medicago truncatula TaxID=3880 RepID=A0A072U5V0_MEDTR|nr:hypothetical protein MTR_6g015835 [Medicago truncatula]